LNILYKEELGELISDEEDDHHDNISIWE